MAGDIFPASLRPSSKSKRSLSLAIIAKGEKRRTAQRTKAKSVKAIQV
jgi:hypothetical protein